jgi:LacI family transcriptional regulator
MVDPKNPSARRVTRADVARYAGVSNAVVSYTINPGSGSVAPATRAKVEEAIRVLGYRPNAAARTLRIGHSMMLGVIVPDSSNPFFASLSRAVEDAAAAHGYSVVVANFEGSPDDLSLSVRNLASRQVDGLIIGAQMSPSSMAAINASGVNAVLVNQFSATPGYSAIGPDLYGGARLGVKHLIDHGHRRIGFVGEHGISDLRERGWRDALHDAGLPPGPIVAANYRREDGYAAGCRLARLEDPPTAVFVSSDIQAIGVLRGLHEFGVEMPGRMAVVSFDGSADSEYSWPALTSVRQPVQAMAQEAVGRLIDGGPDSSFSVHTTELIVRRSCGCRVGAGA